MDSTILISIVGAVALVAGIFAGKMIFAKNTQQKIQEAEEQSRKVVADAEARAETIKKEISINQKEGNLEKQIKENEAIKDNLNRQIEVINLKRNELEKHQEEHI